MHQYTHVKAGSRESLTIFTPSGAPIVATLEHPQFAELLEGAQSDAPIDDLRNLADLTTVVASHFDTLSERVSVSAGRVFFDGDEVDSTITQQIKRCLEDPDVGDWKPLVLFMENVAANPNEHSREQLFDWLRDRDFTITNNGCFIAYKGVYDRTTDDSYPYQSASTGAAIVNGERFTGRIPNGVGVTVEMPRSDVQHDPTHGCSTGLHVGTYKYAQMYARGALLTVMVNPRDVVSVPTDCNAEKMRVCRYVVSDDEATHPSESAAIESAPEVETYEYEGATYVRSGVERLPVRGDVYLSAYPGTFGLVLVAADDHEDSLNASPQPILTKVYTERISLGIPEGRYVATGEKRSARGGEFYLLNDVVCRAIVDHGQLATSSTILVPLS